MTSQIRNAVLIVLDQNDGQVAGIFDLAYNHIETQNVTWLRKQLRDLEADGEIQILENGNGGRGRKKIIKRNRNSPGYPRKVRP